jgi:hypothetical protein
MQANRDSGRARGIAMALMPGQSSYIHFWPASSRTLSCTGWEEMTQQRRNEEERGTADSHVLLKHHEALVAFTKIALMPSFSLHRSEETTQRQLDQEPTCSMVSRNRVFICIYLADP